jgi:hypothetical protein
LQYNVGEHQERVGHAPASPTERKRVTVDRLHKADAADKESAKMKPSEAEPRLENGFVCGSCDLFKDDVFILRDGSVVCGDCVDLWERDQERQN